MILTIPYSFSPGEEAYSAQVNANFTAVKNAVNDIDNTNIGSAGIYASQIIPTNGTQAVFGGGQNYAFSNALTVNGQLVANAGATFNALTVNGAIATQSLATTTLTASSTITAENLTVNPAGTASYVPALFSTNGQSLGPKSAGGVGSATVTISGGAQYGQTEVAFSSSIAFQTGFQPWATIAGGAVQFCATSNPSATNVPWAVQIVTLDLNHMVITVSPANGGTPNSTYNVTVAYGVFGG